MVELQYESSYALHFHLLIAMDNPWKRVLPLLQEQISKAVPKNGMPDESSFSGKRPGIGYTFIFREIVYRQIKVEDFGFLAST